MAPRQSHTTTTTSSSSSNLGDRTLILDPGTHTLKAGFVAHNISTTPNPSTDCHVIQNTIARGSDPFNARKDRIYIADQLDSCRDFAEMSFRRPVEKGYLVNWDGELDIWKQVFFREGARLHCDPHNTNLLLTEPPNSPKQLQSNTDQIIFEELQFASYHRCIGATLNAYNPPPSSQNIPSSSSPPTSSPQRPSSPQLPTELPPPSTTPQPAVLIIDASHTSTTITPLLHGRPIHPSIVRLDISGRLLTNRLKELISLRHFNLMDDSWLMNQVKEDTCFVSTDFKRDMEGAWAGNIGTARWDAELGVEYELPDYSDSKHLRGIVRPFDAGKTRLRKQPLSQAQSTASSFPLSTHRFLIPELLFNPRILGLNQAGLAECVAQSLASIPYPALHSAFLRNIVCVGGTSRLPGLAERVEAEVRALVPGEYSVNVSVGEDPIKASWTGGARMIRGLLDEQGEAGLRDIMITRAEYEEHGAGWVQRVFAKGAKSRL